jgi:RimJ/RimL family protein N-acetyltransferase
MTPSGAVRQTTPCDRKPRRHNPAPADVLLAGDARSRFDVVAVIFGATPVQTERLRGDRVVTEDLEPWSRVFLDDQFAGEEWPYDLRTPEYALKVHDKDRAHWQRFGFGPWSVRERHSGAYVGRIGLDYTSATGRPEVQIGWIVGAPHRGKGYAAEFATEALRVAFEVLELDEVVALITPENETSLAIAAHLGFAQSGEVEHHELPHLLFRLHRVI